MPDIHLNVEKLNCNGNAVPAATAAPSTEKQRRGWDANEDNTLLVVAVLITTLTYQLGTNLPGGYFQDTSNGHVAGDSIMRHRDIPRYYLFMTGSWAGFAASMLVTLALLVGVPAESRLVRWPFTVAYSSLVLTFITSSPRANLAWALCSWVVVLCVLFVTVSFRNWNRQDWKNLLFNRIFRC